MILVLEKELILYFYYRNEIDEQINDVFSFDWGKEYSIERLKLKNGKEIHVVV